MSVLAVWWVPETGERAERKKEERNEEREKEKEKEKCEWAMR